MVENPSGTLDSVFSALADPTRRALLARLARGAQTVGELAEPFDMSLAAVSKHLQVLGRAGLVHHQREGRQVRCELSPEPLRAVADWVRDYESFWNDRLTAMAQVLREERQRKAMGLEKGTLK